jgi:stress response protein YsnF
MMAKITSITSTTSEPLPPQLQKPVQSKTEIIILFKREEIVVSKKQYMKEEIVIKKKPATETKAVTDQ